MIRTALAIIGCGYFAGTTLALPVDGYPVITSASLAVHPREPGDPEWGDPDLLSLGEFWINPSFQGRAPVSLADLAIGDAGHSPQTIIPAQSGDWLEFVVVMSGGIYPMDMWAAGHPWHNFPGVPFVLGTNESTLHFALSYIIGFESQFPRYLVPQPSIYRGGGVTPTMRDGFIVFEILETPHIPEPSTLALLPLAAMALARRSDFPR